MFSAKSMALLGALNFSRDLITYSHFFYIFHKNPPLYHNFMGLVPGNSTDSESKII
jgi:hypothetical protein